MPPCRELHGVGQQVHQHLPQAPRVAFERFRHARAHLAHHVDLPALDLIGHQVDGVVEGGGQVEGHALDLQVSGFDLREVEDVVDHREQVLGRSAHGLRVVVLLGRQRRVQQQARHADHAVERRADLVAHVGEKLALGAAAVFGALAGRVQFRRLVV